MIIFSTARGFVGRSAATTGKQYPDLYKFVTLCRLPQTLPFYLIDLYEFGRVTLTSSDGMSVAHSTAGEVFMNPSNFQVPPQGQPGGDGFSLTELLIAVTILGA